MLKLEQGRQNAKSAPEKQYFTMEQLNASYWEQRYASGQTGWNIGYASPALVEFVHKEFPDKAMRILIPGAGNGHEAEWLFKHGYEQVYILDIAQAPLMELRTRMPLLPESHLIHGDFFEHQGQYDLILEQTFFCALDPTLRPAYVKHMHKLLKPEGHLAGLLFCVPMNDNQPPFGGSVEEYTALFSSKFHLKSMLPCAHSIPQRLGNEVFFEAIKK
jgi:SAM-dependent methyltransferase